MSERPIKEWASTLVYEFLRYPEMYYFGELINQTVTPDVYADEYDVVSEQLLELIHAEFRNIAARYQP